MRDMSVKWTEVDNAVIAFILFLLLLFFNFFVTLIMPPSERTIRHRRKP